MLVSNLSSPLWWCTPFAGTSTVPTAAVALQADAATAEHRLDAMQAAACFYFASAVQSPSPGIVAISCSLAFKFCRQHSLGVHGIMYTILL